MPAMLPLIVFASLTTSTVPVDIGGDLFHPSRVMVKLKEGQSVARLNWGSAKLIKYLPEIRWAILETPKGKLQLTRSILAAKPGIELATFDRAARPSYTPNDNLWADQWSLVALKADLAWDISLGSNSTVIAVIDTGVQVDHPDLAANIWVNGDEIPGNSIDDDNNGYVDDINGYDFAYNDAVPNDVYGHGTPCAGIAGAVGDNTIGLSGVAPRTKIMALKACLDSGYFYDSMTAPAYLYAANNGARVLSMSYFSDQVSPIERDGIDYCWANNVLPVAAAGNSATVIPHYPAGYDNVLSVAAISPNGNKAGFSNYGAWVDVAAGGTGLVATSLGGGYTMGFGGTSGACPHVSGLAALLMGANPAATNAQVRYAIEDTATGVNQAPFGEYCNYGKANAQAAMQAILSVPAPPRTPVVRYVSMLGYQPNDMHYWSDDLLVARVYGRGFQAPRVVTANAGPKSLVVRKQTRDYVDITMEPPMLNPFEIRVDGQLVSSIDMPSAARVCYPVSEISTPSASTTGGFVQALKEDSSFVRCTRQSNGDIVAQMTFHKMSVSRILKLRIRRKYSAVDAQSMEHIRIYDWSSASYPYGNFIELSAAAPTTGYTTSEFTLENPTRFFDDERTLYVVIETVEMPSGAELHIDEMNIQSPR